MAERTDESGPDGRSLIGKAIAHYRILERIGQGGMGVVYRASDESLDRIVALKFLPPLVHDAERALERFLAEARTASALDHPNICTIYEIGEAESGETFIAMACYDGETLEDKLRRGPLGVDQALDYAIQLARGLAKAHEAGIVHRDMKPANVMVTSDGVAKILDFGLAKVDDQVLTRTGEVLGTLDYMSPEQVEGVTLDAGTDIWSLGAMLYTMLAGRHPFAETTRHATMYAVLHKDPPPITEFDPDVPPALAQVLTTCLQKDRTRRFANARELLGALEVGHVSGPVSGGYTFGGFAAAGRVSRLRRRARIGLAAAALVAVIAVIPATRHLILGALTPDAALARTYVAVIPSGGGAESDQILAEGLTHTVTGELARLGTGTDALWVLPAGEILNQEVRTAQRIYELYGVNAIVMVSITRIGEPRVTVTLVDPKALRTIRQVDLPLPDDEEFQARLPAQLAVLMGFGTESVVATAGGRITTSPDAFNFYAQARGYSARLDEPVNLDRAIELFQAALASDPDYAPAHAGLCETRFEQFRLTNDTTLVQAARPSCERALELGHDLVEVLVPVSSVYLRTGLVAEARRTLEDALDREPMNADAHRWLARVYEELGLEEMAVAEYETAIRLNPRMWIYHSDLAGYLLYRSRYEEAIPHFTRIRTLAPGNRRGDLGLGGLYAMTGRFKESEAVLEPLVESSYHPRAFSNMGLAYWGESRLDEAVEVLEEGTRRFPSDIWTWRWLAHVRYWRGDRAEARAAWREVIDLLLPVLEVNPDYNDGLDGVAEAYAALGDESLARSYLARLDDNPGLWDYHVFHSARIAEMLGDRQEALRRLEVALRRGYSLSSVEWDPWLANLRTDPRYEDVRAAASGP